MTSAACICEPGFRVRIKKVLVKMLRNSSKKLWRRYQCQGLGQNSLFSNLNFYCYYDYCLFYLILTGNNEPFRVTPSTASGWYSYSVSGGPALTTVLVFEIFSYFVSICLSMCQSVCLNICLQLISSFWKLATINWLVYICEPGFRARIKSEDCVCIRILRNYSEKSGGGISVRVWVRTASAATINTCLFCWTCM